MSIDLAPPLDGSETLEAASSRFFVAPETLLPVVSEPTNEDFEAAAAHQFAEERWRRYGRFMRGPRSLLLQKRVTIGTDGQERFIDSNDPNRWGSGVVGLTLDGSLAKELVFGWQIGVTMPSSQRLEDYAMERSRLFYLYIGQRGWWAAARTYDQQGAPRGDLKLVNPRLVQDRVAALADHPDIAGATANHAKVKKVATKDLRVFDRSKGAGNFNYDQALREKRSLLKDIGFHSTRVGILDPELFLSTIA